MSELKGWVSRIVLGVLPGALLLLLAAVVVSAGGMTVMERRVTTLVITLVIVLGLQVFTGNSGIVSFGHVGFMALGAYTSALLTIPPAIKSTTLRGLPEFVATSEFGFGMALMIATGLVVVVALVVGIALVRLSGAAGAIATFSFLVIVNVVLSGWGGVTGGRRALYGMPSHTTVWWAFALGVSALLIARLFRDSPLGVQLRASRDDEIVAQAMGIRVRRIRLLAWILSAALAGLSGALLAHFIGAFSPQQFFLTETITVLAMLIVGGMSTVSGAFVGTTVVYVAAEVLRTVETVGPRLGLPNLFGLSQIGIALLLLATLYLRPTGIMGRWELDERLRPVLRSPSAL